MFARDLARSKDSAVWHRTIWWPSSSLMKHPLGINPGVQSKTPIAAIHPPCSIMPKDLARLVKKLLGKGMPKTVEQKDMRMANWRSQWYCPSTPMWSVEWRWKRRSSWASATAPMSCVSPCLAGGDARSKTTLETAYRRMVAEMPACSKFRRWLEGMVPSGSNGVCLEGPTTNSMEMEAKEPAMITCHKPIKKKPKPEQSYQVGSGTGGSLIADSLTYGRNRYALVSSPRLVVMADYMVIDNGGKNDPQDEKCSALRVARCARICAFKKLLKGLWVHE
nr:Os09g0445000 [Ipomoea batatas]